ncbi:MULTISPECIES: sugar porter family MFS transporter [unclassified Streptomyces]|uniref:sugar porter family MFS transporter n=1 Tax=unclassified Streptomyces TaxID=2593676 RepID=UPI0004C7C571|nr:sugar porter family MFS transporter [Streptomyces sp. NRRL F-2747]
MNGPVALRARRAAKDIAPGAARPPRGVRRAQLRTLAVAVSAGALIGVSISTMNESLTEIASRFGLSPLHEGMVVSALLVGALVGSLGAGVLTGRIGRRRILILAGTLSAGAAVLCTVAPGAEVLTGGRFLIGLGMGVTSAVGPVLVADLAPARTRGSLVTAYQVSIAVAMLAALALGMGPMGHGGWRVLFAVNALPCIALCLSALLVPESPGDLMARGRAPEALAVLRSTRDRDEAAAEVAVLSGAHPTQHRSVLRCAADPVLRRPLAIAVGAALMNPIVGIGAVVYYSTLVFSSAGVPGGAGARSASLMVGIVNVVMSFVALRLIRRHGRRPLLSAGLAGMAAALGVAACFQMVDVAAARALTLAAVLGYIACYAFSAGPLSWVLFADVLPPELRARVSGGALAGTWAVNLAIALLFPVLVGTPAAPARLAGAFLFFAVITLLILALLRRYVPETKDRTLAELRTLFDPSGPARTR